MESLLSLFGFVLFMSATWAAFDAWYFVYQEKVFQHSLGSASVFCGILTVVLNGDIVHMLLDMDMMMLVPILIAIFWLNWHVIGVTRFLVIKNHAHKSSSGADREQ
jgi:Na+/alanine symporter